MKKTNVRLKQELQRLYQVPEPKQKKEFIQAYKPLVKDITLPEFMWEQLGYMKKWVWFVTGGLLLLFWMVSRYLEKEAVMVISAMVPFLALAILVESTRSKTYQMEELELATRFSLRSVWLARMGALGVGHLIVLTLTICCVRGDAAGISSFCYILVPYLSTVCLGIYLSRQPRNRDLIALSYGVPSLISAFTFLSRFCLPIIYTGKWMGAWMLACLVLLYLTGKEGYLFYRQARVLA